MTGKAPGSPGAGARVGCGWGAGGQAQTKWGTMVQGERGERGGPGGHSICETTGRSQEPE